MHNHQDRDNKSGVDTSVIPSRLTEGKAYEIARCLRRMYLSAHGYDPDTEVTISK